MPLKWSEVIEKDEYKSLPETEKAYARIQYFNETIAPQVPEQDKAVVMGMFFKDAAKMETDTPGAWDAFKATGKALYRVPAAITTGLAMFPLGGLAATVRGGGRAEEEKQMGASRSEQEQAADKEFMAAIKENQEVPMWWIKTPEEQQSLELIMKPMEWVDNAAAFYGDLAYKKWKNPDIAAGVKTAVEIAAFFGIPSLINKLRVSLKTGKINRTKTAVREIHQERARILKEEPNRLNKLSQAERSLAQEKKLSKSAAESAQVFIDEFAKSQSAKGRIMLRGELGKKGVLEGQPVTPGMKEPYAGKPPELKPSTKDPGYVIPDYPLLRKGERIVSRGKPKVEPLATKLPDDIRPLMGKRSEAYFKRIIKNETGGIPLPDTKINKHARTLSENPAWGKVHGMMGKETKTFSASGFLTTINEKMFDRFARLKKVSPKTYEEARVFSAYKDISFEKFNELKVGLKGVSGDELLFTDYVSAHRALTRSQRGLKNPNGVTLQDAKGAIRAIEKNWKDSGRPVQDLKTSFKNFQDWTHKYILKEALDSGIISKESYSAIRKNNEFYATFEILDHLPKDINDIPSLPSKEYFSVSNQKIIQSMTGTEKKMANPIEATVKKFTRAQATFARNKVASTLVDDPMASTILRPVASNPKEFGIMKNQGLNPVLEGAWSKQEFGTINRFKNGRVEKYLVPKEIADTMK